MKLIRTLGEKTFGPDTTNEEIADTLVGTWTARSMMVSNDANPRESVDLMAEGGSLTLTLTAEGTYQGNFTSPRESEAFSGTYVVNGFSLALTERGDPDPEIVKLTLVAGVLTLMMDASWAFDDEGTREDATMVVGLRKCESSSVARRKRRKFRRTAAPSFLAWQEPRSHD